MGVLFLHLIHTQNPLPHEPIYTVLLLFCTRIHKSQRLTLVLSHLNLSDLALFLRNTPHLPLPFSFQLIPNLNLLHRNYVFLAHLLTMPSRPFTRHMRPGIVPALLLSFTLSLVDPGF